MESRYFEIHGVSLTLSADSAVWAEAVDEIVGAYGTPTPPESVELKASIHSGDAPERPDRLEERGRFGDLAFFWDAEQRAVWIDVYGRGWVHVEPELGRLQAWLDLDPVEDGWRAAHHGFYPALLELLKFRGLFPVHAGLMAREGRGALICGASGSGKTTLSLALAKRGWSLLADDTCFVRDSGAGIEALAFWEDLHVTPETAERFDELAFLRDQAPRRANWKRHFGVDQLEGIQLAERCEPRWIVFPQVAGLEVTECTPLPSMEALLRLTPQSVIAAQPAVLESHMAVLAELCRSVAALELKMSSHLDEVCARLESALDSPA